MKAGNRQQARGNSKNVALIPSALGALLFAFCISAEAQQPKKVPRIGYLSATSPSVNPTRVEAFRQGLRELGYVEGKNLSLSGDMQREN